jgi:hypothetical protein
MASGAAPARTTSDTMTATNQAGNARIERIGNQRILKIDIKSR